MAWTQTAPTLPNGSAWEQEKRIYDIANHWSLDGTVSVARLNGKQFAVKVVVTSGNGSYGTYYAPSYWTLRCDIGSVTGTADTSFRVSKGTTTFYFVGEADAGVTITVKVGGVDAAFAPTTAVLTAPAMLDNSVFVKGNGVWRRGQMKIKVGGVWQDVFPKIKTGGVWK